MIPDKTMSLLLLLLLVPPCLVAADYSITIHPEYLSKGGHATFDPDAWNGKMGLDPPGRIAHVMKTGARTGRWLNSDLKRFQKVPEDPHKKGYPDPAYFKDKHFQQELVAKYLDNLHQYGSHRPIMLELKGLTWPHWMDTSDHHGHLPNNLDAAAEFISLFVQAIDEGTHGASPPYFEPINEPNTFWKDANWTSMIDIFKLVNHKLKVKLPHLKVGGPAWSGGVSQMDKWDFGKYHMITDFLDMSLGHLDFFSFHPFNSFHVEGNKHHFSGPNEARLVGAVDMIESYANMKSGKDVPIIFSAHGLAPISGIPSDHKSPFLDWAYMFLHNANIMTFLELRSVVERAVAFLLSYTDLHGQESINYSILDHNNHERDIALTFHLWENFTSSMKFLRTDSQFHNAERLVQSHALYDTHNQKLTVLLQNYDTSPSRVKLNFTKGFVNSGTSRSSCLALNSQKIPKLTIKEHVHVAGGHVTLQPEAICFYEFTLSHNAAQITSTTENIRYGKSIKVTIVNNAAKMSIMLHQNHIQSLEYARLRISVSFKEHSANVVPTSVRLNGHLLSEYYVLHEPGVKESQQLWGTVEYSVPVDVPRVHTNNIDLTFAQSNGRVAAVALILGNKAH